MKTISVIIADDQKLFASTIELLIEKYSADRIKVLGIAHDGRELVEKVGRLRPDLALVDVRMPGMDGIEATQLIRDEYPDVRVLILTTYDDDEYVEAALKYGASGYVLKDAAPEDLMQAFETALSGGIYISSEVAERLENDERKGYSKHSVTAERIDIIKSKFPDFVQREAEVMDLLMMLYDNFEIAEKLTISEQTVKNYTSTIYAKLGVKDRVHAIRMVRNRLSECEVGLF
jgi:DNA-binding NarL/FixJ family response regulator